MTHVTAGVHSLIVVSKAIALDSSAVVEQGLVALFDKSKHIRVPPLRIFLPSACKSSRCSSSIAASYKSKLFMLKRNLDSSPIVSLGHGRSRVSRVIERNVKIRSSVREVMNRIIMGLVALTMSDILEDMVRKQGWLIFSCLDSIGRNSNDLNRIIAVATQVEHILDARRSIIARERSTTTHVCVGSVDSDRSCLEDIADIED